MSSVYTKLSKTVSKIRHKIQAYPATIYWVIHMKFKEIVLALVLGILLPLLLFLLAEKWQGPTKEPQETIAIETIDSETQSDSTDAQGATS